MKTLLQFALALLLCAPTWAQYDFHETFEGSGAGCALVETWVTSPTEFSADSSMTGACNILNLPTSGYQGQGGMAAASMCVEWQYQKDADHATTNQNIFRTRNSGGTNRVVVTHVTTGRIAFSAPGIGGTDVGPISNDTTHTIEMCTEKGPTGTDDAKVKVRLNGGSFVERTDGDWADDVDRWLILGANTANERFDEIKICSGTYIGVSECDPPVKRWRPLLF